MSKKDKFIQAEKTDCNNIPLQPIILARTLQGIYSWWYFRINWKVVLILETKFSDLISIFEGKDINYTDIGLICFALNNSLLTDNYHIYDDNNADTNGFESFYNEELQTRIFK